MCACGRTAWGAGAQRGAKTSRLSSARLGGSSLLWFLWPTDAVRGAWLVFAARRHEEPREPPRSFFSPDGGGWVLFRTAGGLTFISEKRQRDGRWITL